MDFLSQQMAAILQELQSRGFQMPIWVAAIGLNGSMFAGSFTPAGFVPVTEQIVDGAFKLPINFIFVDGVSGDAARVVIERPDQREYTIN